MLGLKEEPGKSLTQTLADSLKAKHLLLVLDNCEHLLAAFITQRSRVRFRPRYRKGAGLWASHGPASVGALTRSSITCQTSLSSWFSFQMP